MRGQPSTAFMSNKSALGTGKTDCHDMLKQIINDNIVIFHWQEKRVSGNVANKHCWLRRQLLACFDL